MVWSCGVWTKDPGVSDRGRGRAGVDKRSKHVIAKPDPRSKKIRSLEEPIDCRIPRIPLHAGQNQS